VLTSVPTTVASLSGDLDFASRNPCFDACVAGGDVVDIDMAALTFMDCSGYGGLIAARLVLEGRGGSLTLRNAHGQPARLLTLLGQRFAA
jgi:anti-anti-sigma factor